MHHKADVRTVGLEMPKNWTELRVVVCLPFKIEINMEMKD